MYIYGIDMYILDILMVLCLISFMVLFVVSHNFRTYVVNLLVDDFCINSLFKRNKVDWEKLRKESRGITTLALHQPLADNIDLTTRFTIASIEIYCVKSDLANELGDNCKDNIVLDMWQFSRQFYESYYLLPVVLGDKADGCFIRKDDNIYFVVDKLDLNYLNSLKFYRPLWAKQNISHNIAGDIIDPFANLDNPFEE